jgi:hypothetical protein
MTTTKPRLKRSRALVLTVGGRFAARLMVVLFGANARVDGAVQQIDD